MHTLRFHISEYSRDRVLRRVDRILLALRLRLQGGVKNALVSGGEMAMISTVFGLGVSLLAG